MQINWGAEMRSTLSDSVGSYTRHFQNETTKLVNNGNWLVGCIGFFLTCFCIAERQKYTGKKVRLNRGSNSQLPDHVFDTLTTEPPGRGFITESNNKQAVIGKPKELLLHVIEHITFNSFPLLEICLISIEIVPNYEVYL